MTSQEGSAGEDGGGMTPQEGSDGTWAVTAAMMARAMRIWTALKEVASMREMVAWYSQSEHRLGQGMKTEPWRHKDGRRRDPAAVATQAERHRQRAGWNDQEGGCRLFPAKEDNILKAKVPFTAKQIGLDRVRQSCQRDFATKITMRSRWQTRKNWSDMTIVGENVPTVLALVINAAEDACIPMEEWDPPHLGDKGMDVVSSASEKSSDTASKRRVV